MAAWSVEYEALSTMAYTRGASRPAMRIPLFCGIIVRSTKPQSFAGNCRPSPHHNRHYHYRWNISYFVYVQFGQRPDPLCNAPPHLGARRKSIKSVSSKHIPVSAATLFATYKVVSSVSSLYLHSGRGCGSAVSFLLCMSWC
jgi:hypothetical protein